MEFLDVSQIVGHGGHPRTVAQYGQIRGGWCVAWVVGFFRRCVWLGWYVDRCDWDVVEVVSWARHWMARKLPAAILWPFV